MMNPEIKGKWVEALRSGRYKQGTEHLLTLNAVTGEREYCCLGVLCDLALQAGVKNLRLVESVTTSKYGRTAEFEVFENRDDGDGGQWHELEEEVAPDPVVEWAGLPDYGPMKGNPMLFREGGLGGLGSSKAAAEWNDTMGASFDEIADMIERTEGL